CCRRRLLRLARFIGARRRGSELGRSVRIVAPERCVEDRSERRRRSLGCQRRLHRRTHVDLAQREALIQGGAPYRCCVGQGCSMSARSSADSRAAPPPRRSITSSSSSLPLAARNPSSGSTVPSHATTSHCVPLRHATPSAAAFASRVRKARQYRPSSASNV